MLQALKNKSKKIASTLAAGVLLFSQFAVVPSVGATNPTNTNDWPYWCSANYDGGVKFDHPTDDTENGIKADFSFNDKEVDITSVDASKTVKLVVVKAGSTGGDDGQGNEIYNTAPFNDLTAPSNKEISHVIVCYDEVQEGSVKVNKKVDADGNGSYEGGNTTANTLGFDWGLDAETPARNMGTTASGVTTGAHTVTENSVNGFVFTGWYLTDEEDNSGQHQTNCTYPQGTALPVNVTVVKNETAEVTFCNKAKTGSITIVKDAQPNSTQDFDFNVNQEGPGLFNDFDLEDDGNENDSVKSSKTFEGLLADDYVITEEGEADWKLASITCSDGATVVTDKENGKVTITLGYGDAVTCTFVNQKKGEIKVYKHTDPAGDQTEFDIEATTENGVVYGDATRDIADGQYETFSVGFGTYDIEETLPDGWVQEDSTCENVVINAENLKAVCHIYNTKEAKLKIVKQAYPEDGQDFLFTSEQLGDFTLDVDDDATYESYKQFSGLKEDVYTVKEEAVENWQLVYIYCDNGYENFETFEDGVNVKLYAGDDVTCYFVNVKDNTVTGHKFNDINGNHVWDENEPGLEGWTIELTNQCRAQEEVISLLDVQNEVVNDCEEETQTTVTDENGAYAFTGLEPGSYVVCEVQKANWTQTFPETEDGCHEIYIEGPGEVVTADFGNKAKPQVLGEVTPDELVKTGASTAQSFLAGMTILSALAALHFVTVRRKDHVNAC